MVEAWYAILCLLIVAYAVLDGWNIGCGMMQFVVARTPAERRLVVSAIGPLWTFYEVFLVAVGGVVFVAFPAVMATALPGFYLTVFVWLWCVLGRGLSLEFGGHIDDPLWRSFWDMAFAIVNVLIAVLLGAFLGNLIRGVPLGESGKFSLSFFTDFRSRGEVGIFDWYTLTVAAFTVLCLAAHGASYLVWRTEGSVHTRSLVFGRRLWRTVFVLMPVITAATATVRPAMFTAMMARPLAWLAVGVAFSGAIAIVMGQKRGLELRAFLGGCAFIAGLLAAAAAGVFPVMLHSIVGDIHSMTAYSAAAPSNGLTRALFWWPPAMVLSIGYFIVVFRNFRGKVRLGPALES